MNSHKLMKSSMLILIVILTFVYACDKAEIILPTPPPASQKDKKPDTPLELGSIRGYFGNQYKTFTQQIDSFSNMHYYGSCNNTLKQINLIRRDSAFTCAIFIMGYSVDSLPTIYPVPTQYGKFTDLQFYPNYYKNNLIEQYHLISFYGVNVFITNYEDDILTGRFSGFLSAYGKTMNVTEGEFKIKVFRKYVPCDPPSN